MGKNPAEDPNQPSDSTDLSSHKSPSHEPAGAQARSTGSHSNDPPRVAEPPVIQPRYLRRRDSVEPFSELTQWIEDTLGSESYGAPRVFDLYTLLAITLAFALMFAFLQLIEPLLADSLPAVAIALGAFVTLTAIAQLALWNGKKPRIASLIAGPVIWFFIAIGIALQNPRELLSIASVLGLTCTSIFGILAGYLGGALVAGVFLLADLFRNKLLKHSPEESLPANDDAIWNSDD